MSNPPPAHPTTYEDDENNLASRIFQSAANLARSLVNDSNPTSTTNVLANSVGSTGKAGPSSAVAEGLSSSSLQADVAARGRGLVVGSKTVGAEEGFREAYGRSIMQSGEEDVAREMDAFIHPNLPTHDTVYAPVIANDQFPQDLSTAWKGKAPLHTTDPDKSHKAWINQFQNKHATLLYNASKPLTVPSYPTNDIQVAESRDGAEVISLLTTPGSLTTPSILTSEIQDTTEVSADELFPAPQTPTSRAAVANYKADLPPPPTFALKEAVFSELANRFPLGEEGLDGWLSMWDQVMERYTDEVWGPEEPLVREAKGEVEKVKAEVEAGLMGQGKAVERLRMILEHLRMGGR